ncbi:nucleotidyltransferase [Paenibacillus sp. J2TS4]|uniref:nucleotidyltransferase n=1 Tax=Paenibacillus sp. J2TS4 TaxID=2807194 RepID=UPI001B0F022B|nr:nucleotidyltransferase [Paenibacillus sp. J2TS4]GIP33004.1 UPF0348 protein YlbM [Paenibacillus sp. J2TS4]
MKTVGLIVEYNPLHNGHVYHFEQSKTVTGADAAIAVMSGHWLQRGEPALVNKWARAEMALRMGVDVVLELPVAYSSQAAEWFAYGAVRTLDDCGAVDSLCFGSEGGDVDWLSSLAERLHEEQNSFQRLLAERLEQGLNYPSAYSAAIQAWLGKEAAGNLNAPNNTLGLHYLMALKRLNSSIVPATITRHNSGYHDQDATDERIASATAIRRLLDKNGQEAGLQQILRYVPSYTLDILSRELQAGRAPITWNHYLHPLLHQLVTKSADELHLIHEVTEGLEHRLKQSLPEWLRHQSDPLTQEDAFEALIRLVKTKRYTRTKLQRMLVRILLNHYKVQLSREALGAGPQYIRVLGFSSKGRLLLKRMKQNARCPILVKIPRECPSYLEMDIRATGAYSLGYSRPSSGEIFRDYYEPPLRMEPD